MNKLLREFTKIDWTGFAGAELFQDGSSPLIAEYGELYIIIDGSGLTAATFDNVEYMLNEDNSDKEYLIDVADKILDDCKGLLTYEIKEYLKRRGAKSNW